MISLEISRRTKSGRFTSKIREERRYMEFTCTLNERLLGLLGFRICGIYARQTTDLRQRATLQPQPIGGDDFCEFGGNRGGNPKNRQSAAAAR
ncbi:hypothetical protein Nepgr_011555 [Nepenthes gracilis]|uniref:Uncharacterized protein n=1 Tax=Nepenthes gracilis TaxID=150966 RepID=A0AAD3SF25_NEPGR|nr:hypothetical protein Nepgr_011555 [Nepenthes gracilis]